MSAPRVAGVLGGMGPAATVDFMQRVLDLRAGGGDGDHVRMVVDCHPRVPDRIAAIEGRGPSPGPELAAMAAGLQRIGADFIVMPCNTAHAFRADIEAAITVPFIDMVAETAAAARALAPGAGAAAVLATPGSVRAGLYQSALAAVGMDCHAPEGAVMDDFMAAVMRVKAGDLGPETRALMAGAAERVLAGGGGVLIAGCTEIPLVLAAEQVAVPVLNSTDVLAQRTVAFAFQR